MELTLHTLATIQYVLMVLAMTGYTGPERDRLTRIETYLIERVNREE